MIAVGQPGHIDQIKQTNAGAVYRLIDQLGPISRIELSKRAQLAPASITKIVRELLEAHLVKETEYQEVGSRGRPAVGLVLDTEAWHYLSARISRGSITLALRDISSKLVVEEQLPLAAEHRDPLLKRILSEVDQFFIRHQSKLERLTAIAITLPGIIDVASGVVHRMRSTTRWRCRSARRWKPAPACRSICSTTSAPGPWRKRCTARRAAAKTSSRW